MKRRETGASTSAAATRVGVDFVLAERELSPPSRGAPQTVIQVGVPELPVLGPLAMLVVTCALRGGPFIAIFVGLVFALAYPTNPTATVRYAGVAFMFVVTCGVILPLDVAFVSALYARSRS